MEHPSRRGNYFVCPGAVPAERADRLKRLDLFLNGYSRPIACRTPKPENEEDGNQGLEKQLKRKRARTVIGFKVARLALVWISLR